MIYTKKGDDGTTSLVGGTRVKKYDIRVQTYGEIDHLVSIIGFASTFFSHSDIANDLFTIQNRLFAIESIVACEDNSLMDRLPRILDTDVDFLERKIDEMSAVIPPLKQFIIPSSSQSATILHVCCTQTRRCERLIVECNDTYPQNKTAMKYLNRLSDYFFTLGRFTMKQKKRTEKFFKEV